ncbi:fatty acid CoA ligase FadD9 [Crossiella equi]|uniref:Fatty acid CoA ligase FadD9 n=1 Tax=Crossiella equi TaxID=130796 RepID=A0ABS5AR70_9PSEU|nr:fatty acid CoA ligase FadD9 [Crossiella equi]
MTDPATGRTALRLLPAFQTTTYAELHAQARAIAADWYHHGQAPVRPGDAVAFLGFTSPDYTTADLACSLLGGVAVPLQASTTPERLAPIVAETRPKLLASSVEQLAVAVALALGADCVARLVVFDHHPGVDEEREQVQAARTRLAEAGRAVVLETLDEVHAHGAGLPPAPVHDGDPDRLALLVYTSGSTGTPKGARYSDRLAAQTYRGYFPRDEEAAFLGFNYLPMSHAVGRAMLNTCLAFGGTNYFAARADLSTLFEDIELARPTEVFFVPRIVDVLYRRFTAALAERTEEQAYDLIRERTLGGRLTQVLTGSAPMTAEKTAFLDRCLGLPSHDVYGSTEVGIVLMDHRVVPGVVLGHKLVDVPELGYRTTDTPHPRGELLVRTSTQIDGYFQRPELNAEVFDADGYYRTGDVVVNTAPGEYHYLDRSKNVLKLAQGEFVAVARLDATYLASPLVRHVYVHGESTRAYLLAVVVPADTALERAGGDPAALHALLLAELRAVAAGAGLAPYEIPREIIVETEPFTTANGLLSDINKLLRPRVAQRYGARLAELYERLDGGAPGELVAGDRPVLDVVLEAARAQLGVAVAPEAHFLALGGDSLSALTFAGTLHRAFGVEVPVGVVVSAATDLRALAAHIEGELAGTRRGPDFASVHGSDPTRIAAAELTLDKFLAPELVAGAGELPRPSGAPRTVLLTGANGFLGRFLCLEWLRRLAPAGGRLVCLVRGADEAAAHARLAAAFDSGDAALVEELRELSPALEVLPGDIAAPGLGLSGETFARLAAEVDLVVHPAAFVNHVLPYRELFGPNVVGTAELIRLALTTRLKPLAYVSSVGVLHSGASSSAEDADIRETSPYRDTDGGYAGGYATSKWAGEVLLREAHEHCGLPVVVFRSDLIMAHRRYTGQLNVPDMFTRLVHSLVTTGLAPYSFYRDTTVAAHYDGLPVDFTAAAMTALTEHVTTGHHTYNLLNPHEDGVSLDVVVDWLEAAGHPITRVPSYRDWLTRITAAIGAQPERLRQHSLQPLLHSYAEPADPAYGRGLSTTRFEEAVREAGLVIPHITAELVRKYAQDLKALGLL